jgi:hypothetical protein
VRGPEGVGRLGKVPHGGITEVKLPIEAVIAEGDRVLVRLRFQGRHTGDLMGLAASGRSVDVAVMDLFRIVDGRRVEHWALLDNLGLLRQVGALPARDLTFSTSSLGDSAWPRRRSSCTITPSRPMPRRSASPSG